MPTWDGRPTPQEFNRDVLADLSVKMGRLASYRQAVTEARCGLIRARNMLKQVDELLSAVDRG